MLLKRIIINNNNYITISNIVITYHEHQHYHNHHHHHHHKKTQLTNHKFFIKNDVIDNMEKNTVLEARPAASEGSIPTVIYLSLSPEIS